MTWTLGAIFLGGMGAGVLCMAVILWWVLRTREPAEAKLVCWEAYQVVGCMLSDLGQFGTEQADKILDNLSQARMVHDDVLPWPSFKDGEPVPQRPADNSLGAILQMVAAERERCAKLAESDRFYCCSMPHAIAAAIRSWEQP